MSRSGYCDDLDDDLAFGRWRGQVASAIRGKRGQKALRDLIAALDAMPYKVLITEELQDVEGDVCALGALGNARGINMTDLDPDEPDDVAAAFDIATQLAKEIVYENDEGGRYWTETPEQRYKRMRQWVESHILPIITTEAKA